MLFEMTVKIVANTNLEISPCTPQKSYFVGIPYSLEMIGNCHFVVIVILSGAIV